MLGEIRVYVVLTEICVECKNRYEIRFLLELIKYLRRFKTTLHPRLRKGMLLVLRRFATHPGACLFRTIEWKWNGFYINQLKLLNIHNG